MPRNAAGVYSLPAGNPVVSGTTIASSWANSTMPDIGSEMTNSLDRSGRGGMLASLKGIDGIVTAPLYAFTNEPTTGIWRKSAGTMAFSALGTEIGNVSSSGWSLGFALGAVGTPSVFFLGDPNTGMWSAGADIITWSAGGVAGMQLGANQLTFASPWVVAPWLGAVGTPSYAFNGDLNTGVWSPGADLLAASTGGVEGWRLDASRNFHVNDTAGVSKVTFGNTTAAPSTSGSAANAFLRLVDQGAGSRSIDFGISATFGWIQSRDKNDYAVNYDLEIQPNGGDTFLGITANEIAVKADGRLFGKALHNNAGAVTGTTNQYIASGTYTPTYTAVANSGSFTARTIPWIRVGNVVSVAGSFGAVTSAAGSTVVGISLPIASNFTTTGQIGGTCADTSGIFSVGGTYVGIDTTNDRAELHGNANIGGALEILFSFQYLIN